MFQQQIFPGDHSDIGNGWEKDRNELSRAPLEYIWSAGRNAGVPFGTLSSDINYRDNTTPHDRTKDFPYTMDSNPPRNFNNVWNGNSFAPVWTGKMLGQ